jgi:hypothetical protein
MYQINFTSCGFLSMIFSSCEKSGYLTLLNIQRVKSFLKFKKLEKKKFVPVLLLLVNYDWGQKKRKRKYAVLMLN